MTISTGHLNFIAPLPSCDAEFDYLVNDEQLPRLQESSTYHWTFSGLAKGGIPSTLPLVSAPAGHARG